MAAARRAIVAPTPEAKPSSSIVVEESPDPVTLSQDVTIIARAKKLGIANSDVVAVAVAGGGERRPLRKQFFKENQKKEVEEFVAETQEVSDSGKDFLVRKWLNEQESIFL